MYLTAFSCNAFRFAVAIAHQTGGGFFVYNVGVYMRRNRKQLLIIYLSDRLTEHMGAYLLRTYKMFPINKPAAQQAFDYETDEWLFEHTHYPELIAAVAAHAKITVAILRKACQ